MRLKGHLMSLSAPKDRKDAEVRIEVVHIVKCLLQIFVYARPAIFCTRMLRVRM